MNIDARTRIDSHRLMRTVAAEDTTLSDGRSQSSRDRARVAQQRLLRRTGVHIGVFTVSFIFTAGLLVLLVLLWVRPDALLALVSVSIVAAAVFVACFAGLRMLVLHRLMDEYPDREEDPGMKHHLTKSIAYGFVALVVAIVLAGLLINIASATSTPSAAALSESSSSTS